MCAILSGVIVGVCIVSIGTTDGMIGVCVMSDGVVCAMCRVASRVPGMCVPSAACCDRLVSRVWYIAWCCMEHWRGFSKLQNDIYCIVLAPQVTIKIQRISQDLLSNIGMKYL